MRMLVGGGEGSTADGDDLSLPLRHGKPRDAPSTPPWAPRTSYGTLGVESRRATLEDAAAPLGSRLKAPK